jgi:hypothetical protein
MLDSHRSSNSSYPPENALRGTTPLIVAPGAPARAGGGAAVLTTTATAQPLTPDEIARLLRIFVTLHRAYLAAPHPAVGVLDVEWSRDTLSLTT